jgi:hypothetical protein
MLLLAAGNACMFIAGSKGSFIEVTSNKQN